MTIEQFTEEDILETSQLANLVCGEGHTSLQCFEKSTSSRATSEKMTIKNI